MKACPGVVVKEALYSAWTINLGSHMATQEKAVSDARQHWDRESAKILCVGDILSRRPLVDESGLYLAVSFDEEYARFYNDEVHRLLRESGLPPWSPGYRMPSREMALGAVRSGEPLERLRPLSVKEQRLLSTRTRQWTEEYGVGPDQFASLSERNLLLLGGDTPDGYVVDVLDLLGHVWMARFVHPISGEGAAQLEVDHR